MFSHISEDITLLCLCSKHRVRTIIFGTNSCVELYAYILACHSRGRGSNPTTSKSQLQHGRKDGQETVSTKMYCINWIPLVIWIQNTQHVQNSNGRGLFCFPMADKWCHFVLFSNGQDHWKVKLLVSLNYFIYRIVIKRIWSVINLLF